MGCSGVTVNSAVYVTGPFAGWTDAYPLSDPDGDNIWTGSYDFAPGPLEYKYMVDSWADQENLVDDMVNGASCAPVTDYATYANRQITIVDQSVSVTDTYGSCTGCGPEVAGCTDPDAANYNPSATFDDGSCLYSVDFSVDMGCSGVTVNSAVYVTGPFAGWTDAYPLADPDGDNIWTGSYDFAPGPLEYKYMVDSWADQENLVDDMLNGASCAPVTDYATYANRRIYLQSPTTLDETYGQCTACP
jgi:hypothetical protein